MVTWKLTVATSTIDQRDSPRSRRLSGENRGITQGATAFSKKRLRIASGAE
jgi:hypothetical protein